jgi:hypothetical protein
MNPTARKLKWLDHMGQEIPIGRVYKILGDFNLLSGRTEASSKW